MPAPVHCPHVDKYDHTLVWPSDMPFPVEISGGEARFEYQSRPYGPITSLKGLAVLKGDGGATVLGVRSLSHPRESGYQMEGYVSVGGKTRRAFTSSDLFLVNGKLVSVAILYVCG